MRIDLHAQPRLQVMSTCVTLFGPGSDAPLSRPLDRFDHVAARVRRQGIDQDAVIHHHGLARDLTSAGGSQLSGRRIDTPLVLIAQLPDS
ncbi:MAG: hypothetical protein HY246_05530 [Proteobacteria bacterium]|nr:hypothetical protein [Pseudomonadota bacterium]